MAEFLPEELALLEVLFGTFPEIPENVTIPNVTLTPLYLALKFVTQSDESYAAFVKFLRTEMPITLMIVGTPSRKNTLEVLKLVSDADPTVLELF